MHTNLITSLLDVINTVETFAFLNSHSSKYAIIYVFIATFLINSDNWQKKLEKVDLVITDTPHSKFLMRQWKEWNMLWFILQLIHFMAIKNLQILVIDKLVCIALPRLHPYTNIVHPLPNLRYIVYSWLWRR
jgi:hypothetical protein